VSTNSGAPETLGKSTGLPLDAQAILNAHARAFSGAAIASMFVKSGKLRRPLLAGTKADLAQGKTG